jgi:hypothetical protein
MKEEKFWVDNLYVLLKPSLIPTNKMTFVEKLNTLMRIIIIVCIVLLLIVQDVRVFIFVILAALLTVILKLNADDKKKKIDTFLNENNVDIVNNEICTKPSYDNPFMNPTITDYNQNRPGACDIDDTKTKFDIVDKFNAKIFKEVDDIYGRFSSERQFYTVPNTTIPNKQDELAKWLYTGSGKACKEDGGGNQCFRNIEYKRNM